MLARDFALRPKHYEWTKGPVAPSNLMRYHFAPPMNFINFQPFEAPEIAYD
jgi:hypothetical protein